MYIDYLLGYDKSYRFNNLWFESFSCQTNKLRSYTMFPRVKFSDSPEHRRSLALCFRHGRRRPSGWTRLYGRSQQKPIQTDSPQSPKPRASLFPFQSILENFWLNFTICVDCFLFPVSLGFRYLDQHLLPKMF